MTCEGCKYLRRMWRGIIPRWRCVKYHCAARERCIDYKPRA